MDGHMSSTIQKNTCYQTAGVEILCLDVFPQLVKKWILCSFIGVDGGQYNSFGATKPLSVAMFGDGLWLVTFQCIQVIINKMEHDGMVFWAFGCGCGCLDQVFKN
jgi:hypothetical protein